MEMQKKNDTKYGHKAPQKDANVTIRLKCENMTQNE